MRHISKLHRRLHAREDGITLVEVLLAIAILGIVTAALAGTFVVSARTHADTTTRFKESHDTQIASAYLANDVQSAAEITTTSCGGTGLVNFRYGDGSLASYVYTVDGESRLTRKFCNPSGTLVNDATLVHYAGGAPTASCKLSGATAWGVCNPDDDSASRPNKVRIAVTEGSGYHFSVSGSRRIHADPASIPPLSAFPPLLALGGNGVQIGMAGNHVALDVNGKIIVNSNATPAVNGNTSNLSYSSIEIFGGGTCTSVCGIAPVNRGTRVPDPFSGLPAPSTAGLPVNPPKVGDTYAPGIYTGAFSPDGILAPGVYILRGGLTMSNDEHAVGNGVLLYIEEGSFSITGQAQLEITPPTSGTYQGISIWQPRTNTSPFAIAGQGEASSLQGVLYLPATSSVTLGTGNGNMAIGSIIAPNITAGGNGLICVGHASWPC